MLSAMYRFPAGSTVSPTGPYSVAEVAGPPSPVNPLVPAVTPATVLMMPLVFTFRTRLLLVSEM